MLHIGNTKNILKRVLFIKLIILLSFVFVFPIQAGAAVLFIDPNDEDREVGDIFPVALMIGSADQAVSLISGTFDFPANLLEVVSVSKKDSIIDMWTTGPSFSNRYGTVDFEGAVLDPGFKGVAGEVLTINFRANKEGQVLLKYLYPKVAVNASQDGNVLEEFYEARFSIMKKELVNEEIPEEPEEPAQNSPNEDEEEDEKESDVSGNGPEAVEVKSTTHPDQDKWYSQDKVDFYWDMPAGAQEVKLLANIYASSSPKVHYDYRIASKSLDEVSDGEWYFHIQLKDDASWGEISHFQFNVDTTAPVDLEISESTTTGEFLVSASDSLSGIDHYEINLDNSSSTLIWNEGDSGILRLYDVASGKHTIYAKVFDRASNTSEASLDFYLEEDLPASLADSELGEVKAEEEREEGRLSAISNFKNFEFRRFDLNLWQILFIILAVLSIFLFICVLVFKKKLAHCRRSAFEKLKTAEGVLNSIYSIAYDLLDSLETAKKKKCRLTAQETRAANELKKILDEVEKEYK